MNFRSISAGSTFELLALVSETPVIGSRMGFKLRSLLSCLICVSSVWNVLCIVLSSESRALHAVLIYITLWDNSFNYASHAGCSHDEH